MTVAICVLAVLVAEVLLGAVTVGVSIDEPTHVSRLQQWLDNRLYVPSRLIVNGDPVLGDSTATPYVYGAYFSVLAHLANVWLGIEPIGAVSESEHAYAVRHLAVAAIGLGAVAVVGLTVRAISGDRVAGLWGAAALLAIPVWTGNAMFNVKDVPVAAGYTFVTAGLVLALVEIGEARRSAVRRWGAVALVGAGVSLAVGTRPPLWLPLACSFLAFAALSRFLLGASRPALRSVAPQALGFSAGLAIVAALHPTLALRPIEWLTRSVTHSANFWSYGYTLTAGRYLEADGPIWYLPAWLFAGVPLLVLGFVVVGISIHVSRAARSFRRPDRSAPLQKSARALAVALIGLQVALLPVAAIVGDAPMYAALRQHLYVVPGIAVLAGLGAASLIQRAREATTGAWRRWSAVVVLALALVAPTVEQTRLFPYNYVYVNPLAGMRGVQGQWETEFQWVSAREAFRRVPRGVEPACSMWLVYRGPTFDSRSSARAPCDAFLRPYREELGSDATVDALPGEVWVVGRTRSSNRPPATCDEVRNVTRSLRGEDIVMSYVLRCRGQSTAAINDR